MKKVVIGSLLAAVAVVGAPGVAAVQADSRTSSAAGSICLYEHDNYKGGRACFSKSDSNLANNRWSSTYRSVYNGASSMRNNTGYRVHLWSGRFYSGTSYTAQPYSYDADLTKNSGNPSFDNNAESLKIG
ncbi:peptidase inhibitor family I36 protein [Nonomuraea sp. B5E05]|uniref:peptidase inhibitor family I36 protein n=1 Tax=Nonomuraea sp. B5E05 TaxID=3153569 RepID=UPI003260EFDC